MLYLLDGHNNVILTVEQGKLKTVSLLGFSDVGMVKSLYVDRDGVLWLSFANIEGAYTAAIDPSGDEAKIVGETQPGYLIDPEAGTLEAADLSLPDEAVVEPSSEETYRMAFSDEALTIQPIGAYFSGRGSDTDYVLTR